jgi:hypothetical protein
MSEPKTIDSTPGQSEKPRSRWPMLAVTILLTAGVACILTPRQLRFFQALEQHRTAILAKPETLDFLTGAAYFRDMDRRLPPDAKIFFSGVIGPDNRLYPYFFARTFLFPHEMEISLDHKADYQVDGFRGLDCSSPDQLRTNGYDLMMTFNKDGSITTLPLTEKGVMKQ